MHLFISAGRISSVSCKAGLALKSSFSSVCLGKPWSSLHFWRTALLGKVFLVGHFFIQHLECIIPLSEDLSNHRAEGFGRAKSGWLLPAGLQTVCRPSSCSPDHWACGETAWWPRCLHQPHACKQADSFVEKVTAAHSSALAWKIPRTEEPGGSRRLGHAGATSLSLGP